MDDDTKLVDRAKRGDEAAFAAILERHYDTMFSLALRLTRDRASAEDITQDVCLALPAKLSGFEGRSRLGGWLYRIVVNAVHDHRRKLRRDRARRDDTADIERDRHMANEEGNAARRWLEERMAGLPEAIRDTLVLVVIEGLSHAQAAEILSVEGGTVSWRMSEARRMLKEMELRE